ncbi:hypothetical protein [Halorientalis salina]|uniref:hypothetical protein n=1 Tax=Halorientalis salina TaxID=2932266 RepID=UPI0010AC7596|nr:hypothetical protein [Halorientalis salina]
MTASYQEIKTLEALTGARETLLDPECGPQDVESALQTAVDALEKTGVDPEPVVEHLNKHIQLTGEDGFPSTSRRQCHSTLSRVQAELRQEFGASPGPDCPQCGTALPRGTSETYCAECRTGSLDPKEESSQEVASTVELVSQILESAEDATNLNLNSDNSTNVHVGNQQTTHDTNNTNININSNNSTNVDIDGEIDRDITIPDGPGSDIKISNGDESSE